MSTLFIYCAGGYGKEVIEVARRLNQVKHSWNAIHFLDDVCEEPVRHDAQVFRFEDACAAIERDGGEVVIASGEPAVRIMLRDKLEARGLRLGTLIDATAIVSQPENLAAGVIISQQSTVSRDAFVGCNVAINAMSIVGHDVQIGENTVISSMVNIGGKTVIGKNSYIGMGALVKDVVRIGDGVIVGMGSVVFNDLPDNVIALGNPARPMRANLEQRVFK
jgi:sugar O-acyltransferase (sialic acid O-acetyltransferase NeuD family)